MARKEVAKEHLFQIVSGTTQDGIFAEGIASAQGSPGGKEPEGGGDDRPIPMAWGLNFDAA